MRPADGAIVVVVTHRGPDGPVNDCLTSLDGCTPAGTHVVVVDNGGAQRDDATPAEGTPADHAYGPGDYTVYRTPNLGYGAALNEGFRRARRELCGRHDGEGVADVERAMALVALNDDVTVEPAWMGPLVGALRADPGLGAVQPRLVDPRTGEIDSVGVTIAPDGAGNDVRTFGAEHCDVVPIDIFTGGAVAFSSAFYDDLDGFDERYFLYYEDVDLALRGSERGWRYGCVPSSTVLHGGGASTSSLGPELARLHQRNRLWTSIRFAAPATIARSFWLAVRRLRHEPRRAHAQGLLQGVAAAPRLLRARRRGGGAT